MLAFICPKNYYQGSTSTEVYVLTVISSWEVASTRLLFFFHQVMRVRRVFSLFLFMCNLEFGDALAAGGVLQGLQCATCCRGSVGRQGVHLAQLGGGV